MRSVYITPCEFYLLAEFREKISANLSNKIKQIPWIRWKQMKDVNGKGRMQWYLAVDKTTDKSIRLTQFAKLLCEEESYFPFSRICPHDLYYEDYRMYFEEYEKYN